jgi:hypothetical protein
MRIINNANGRETTVACAVDIVTDRDGTTHRELQQMVVRLLEELTNEHGEEGALLRPRQLSRILGYQFAILEV